MWTRRTAGPVREWQHPMIATARGPADLTRYAWLAIAAAVVTIALKSVAYRVTGPFGLLSDAAESVVNLVAAIIALVALQVAARPADAGHHYGHGKAEYFSAGLEGLMIFVAAAVILVSAVQRFIHPVAAGTPRRRVGDLNGGDRGQRRGRLALIRAGRTHRSATLAADGKHLMTDVWTSVGVLVGVLLVALTGWERLDPVVAAIVGLNILVTGGRLVASSVGALLDAALTPQETATVTAVLDRFRSTEVDSTACRPASPAGTGSSPCMCSSPALDRVRAAMTCSNRSSRRSRRRCRTPPCNPSGAPRRPPRHTTTTPTTDIQRRNLAGALVQFGRHRPRLGRAALARTSTPTMPRHAGVAA